MYWTGGKMSIKPLFSVFTGNKNNSCFYFFFALARQILIVSLSSCKPSIWMVERKKQKLNLEKLYGHVFRFYATTCVLRVQLRLLLPLKPLLLLFLAKLIPSPPLRQFDRGVDQSVVHAFFKFYFFAPGILCCQVKTFCFEQKKT